MDENAQQFEYSALAVDVDGTLIRTDLLHESVFALLKLNPFYLLMLPLWLLGGKGKLKQEIADRVDLPISLLPYREEFVDYLKQERAAGRRLVLATASNIRYANGIAEHLGIFDDVLASTATDNLSGKSKLAHIKELLGTEKFAYAGNSAVDVPIWEDAGLAVVVNAPKSVEQRAAKKSSVVKVFPDRSNYLTSLIKAMRPHQWLKNLLVFVPLMLVQEAGDLLPTMQAVAAFFSFSFCASSVYLLNDLFDLEADRQHPTKCNRPFAAGDLPIGLGVVAMVALLLLAFYIASLLPPFFLGMLSIYYVITIAYSLWLKRSMLIDVLTLAGLYTIRLIAGAAAIGVAASFWLLAFSMFIFLSLAMIKRYSELQLLKSQGHEKLIGRGYQIVDMETLAALGAASGYLAVMVMALYINSETVFESYRRPEALWILCPMMLYWISRMWVLTRRGEMHEDPVVFTLKDKRTYLLGAIAAAAMAIAAFWPVVREFIPAYFLTT